MVDYSQRVELTSAVEAKKPRLYLRNRKRRPMPDFSFPILLRRMFLAIALILSAALFASAQFDTRSITGFVTDPTGAALPQATVTVSNVATNFQKTMQTDARGGFTASSLPLGNYV